MAVAVKYLKEKFGFKKTDAHAGNGTKEIFYTDNKFYLLISIKTQNIYPGLGFIYEIGEDKGEGFAVNIPLPRRSFNLAYKAFEKIIIPLAEEFRPQIKALCEMK